MKSLSKKQWIAVSLALAVIVLFFFSGSFIGSFFTSGVTTVEDAGAGAYGAMDKMDKMDKVDKKAMMDDDKMMMEDKMDSQKTMMQKQLEVTDTVIGTGATAVAGKTVMVNYTGMFTNGVVFDSSIPRGKPFEFNLGAGQVIAGWDQGIVGMKVGGKRRLVIPPSLGYGSTAYGPIPANSTLVFDVELLGVR